MNAIKVVKDAADEKEKEIEAFRSFLENYIGDNIMDSKTQPRTPLTVLEMVHAALIKDGFDGLYNTDNNCACRMGNLNPCDNMTEKCTAGYLLPCQCGEECGFHIGLSPSDGVRL